MHRNTESKLLLHCLGMGTDEITAARLDQLSASDWDGILQQSARHGVAPLLYQRLQTLGPGSNIPPEVAQRLRTTFLHSALSNMRLYHELARVLRALRDEDIPVIALKGAHLAEVVYGNIALRPMSDVDLLVRKTDLSRVEEKLLEMGYILDEKNTAEFVEHNAHFMYQLPREGLWLEIHWNIQQSDSPFTVDVDGLWERARPAMIAGAKALALSPEDLLLHVCLHTAFRHLFTKSALRSLCDISETIRHYQGKMNWEQVRLRTRQWGVGKCACITLRLARKLLGAAVPDEVLQSLEPDSFDARSVAWAEGRIFAQTDDTIGPSPEGHILVQIDDATGPLSDGWGRLWASKRLLDKLSIFLKTCFPAPQAMAEIYSAPPGSKRVYLYYPIRLKDLLRRHARRAWQLLCRDDETTMWIQREARRVEQQAIAKWLASA